MGLNHIDARLGGPCNYGVLDPYLGTPILGAPSPDPGSGTPDLGSGVWGPQTPDPISS